MSQGFASIKWLGVPVLKESQATRKGLRNPNVLRFKTVAEMQKQSAARRLNLNKVFVLPEDEWHKLEKELRYEQ